MDFTVKMEALNSNSLFNASGLASIFSYLGLNIISWARIANINAVVLVFIGLVSLGFSLMKVYQQYLETRKFKREEEEFLENK